MWQQSPTIARTDRDETHSTRTSNSLGTVIRLSGWTSTTLCEVILCEIRDTGRCSSHLRFVSGNNSAVCGILYHSEMMRVRRVLVTLASIVTLGLAAHPTRPSEQQTTTTTTTTHFVMPPGEPVADPTAVVVAGGGHARFTVLTQSLLRLQWRDNLNDSWNDLQTSVIRLEGRVNDVHA